MMKAGSFYGLIMGALLVSSLQMACTTEPKQDVAALKQQGVLENIFQRKSVRDYTSQPVEEEKINTLLKAAMAAPSGKDRRPWEFVVITERAILDSMAAELDNARMLAKAPLVIVVCGDSTVSSYWYLDCTAAGQNILLAAEALGLGAVWTASYPYADRMEVARRYARLPENVLPLCVIPIGYPSGDIQPKDKFNEAKIHRNTFRQ